MIGVLEFPRKREVLRKCFRCLHLAACKSGAVPCAPAFKDNFADFCFCCSVLLVCRVKNRHRLKTRCFQMKKHHEEHVNHMISKYLKLYNSRELAKRSPLNTKDISQQDPLC